MKSQYNSIMAEKMRIACINLYRAIAATEYNKQNDKKAYIVKKGDTLYIIPTK